jgi:hypothetical protein
LLPPARRGEPQALLAQLSAAGHPLAEHPDSKAALDELALLFEYLGAMNALGSISFDLSLARGLDYYTGGWRPAAGRRRHACRRRGAGWLGCMCQAQHRRRQ